ncbi:MAG TPA: hypothetical protein VIU39_00850 [Anaerolineales bacterium]
MQPREQWPRWAALLQRYRLDKMTAWMLEAGGPLLLLSAQALYFGRSLLGVQRADALARTLEDEGETRLFAAYLHSQERHA